MSELEKRESEIIGQAHEYIWSLRETKPKEAAFNIFLVKKIAELELKIEALENAKPSFSFGGMAIIDHNNCLKCGSKLIDTDPSMMMLSDPPQLSVHCSNCDYKGTRYV